ncbi:PREDICTED: glycerophosphodiester phosphodiesterase 1 isoform X2 [Nanorana parkeri]|uniref:glycerophosphodiester phosphodiesterase 1 isoform X2 n=1 Tax=Nanorana parkeri TaxID=125878 RepID=UPI000854B81E|nr:PREDICTED: glycerophosphodiester phosphodiesterase 1 isoform X2 [Nanorana parkeri]
MLWGEGLLVSFSSLFVLALLISRSPLLSCLLVSGLYLLLLFSRFLPVPESRALHVLRPAGKVSIIAHRGGAHDGPENTLATIRLAAKNGATGVELDLEFTKDGVPILMHDDTVERTTDGSGKLSDLTFSEIRKLNPAAKHRLRHLYNDEKVPTLKEAVEECIHHNLVIYFDVKGHAAQMRQADVNVVTALTHRPWSLSHLGDGKPRFDSMWKHYFYVSMDILLDWALHHILWNFCGISAFLMQKNYISKDYVEKWNNRGIEVVAWTVNNASEKLYCEHFLNCNYITDSMVEDCEPHY